MSKEWTVLHLTDFHIGDPANQYEHLRDGFFREYLNDLSNVIKLNPEIGSKSIDAIVITGDFVNGGELKNFDHAGKIIQHLCNNFRIGKDRVFVCNGNHDIDRKLEKLNDLKGARQAYNAFARTLGNGNILDGAERFSLVKTNWGAHILSIDSTLGASGANRPGTITGPEIDNIMRAIQNENLGSDELLIIASHHPVFGFEPPAPDPEDDEKNKGWVEKHIWRSAYMLYSRLIKTTECPVLWLSGDIHRPQYEPAGVIHSYVTGRLGTSTKSCPTQARRQGRIITISSTGKTRSWICRFEPIAHNDDPQSGEWEIIEKSDPTSLRRKTDKSSRNSTREEEKPENILTSQTSYIVDVKSCCELLLLSELLQTSIMEAITKNGLYHLGRYATSECESTLAWVPMGDLMNNVGLLTTIISKMAQNITEKIIDDEIKKPIIIGLDSWGAILASQISVLTGIKNFCIAGRVGGSTHTDPERICKEMREEIAKCDQVILVSDVIGTGSTLKCVHDDLCETMPEEQKQKIKWSLLSVICDEIYTRDKTLGFAHTHMTACKDLRIPILENDQLPEKNILPADISFMRRQFPLSPSS